MITYGRDRAPAATVRERGHLRARLQLAYGTVRRENAKLHKMIATAAGAELRPGPVLVLVRNRTDRPIGVHDRVFAALPEARAHPEACLGFDGAGEPLLISLQVA